MMTFYRQRIHILRRPVAQTVKLLPPSAPHCPDALAWQSHLVKTRAHQKLRRDLYLRLGAEAVVIKNCEEVDRLLATVAASS